MLIDNGTGPPKGVDHRQTIENSNVYANDLKNRVLQVHNIDAISKNLQNSTLNSPTHAIVDLHSTSQIVFAGKGETAENVSLYANDLENLFLQTHNIDAIAENLQNSSLNSPSHNIVDLNSISRIVFAGKGQGDQRPIADKGNGPPFGVDQRPTL